MSGWRAVWNVVRRPLPGVLIAAGALTWGGPRGARPEPSVTTSELRDRLRQAEGRLRAREGELQLARLELLKANAVVSNSARYRIPADLSAQIYDVASAEGIDTELAFQLVAVESEFTGHAVSPAGAIGLTQVMPSTARSMNPRIRREDLFHHETNLRLGFSYLRELIRSYDGNLRLALLAYNRGPAVVDSIRRTGGNPDNGYAHAVLRGLRRTTQP